jgi:NADPH:quinone reductase-like Zn-dependent oxidoreductase
MKTISLRNPASLANLYADTATTADPGPGEITVRLGAASLNFRDNLVVKGFFPVRDGLIPLSDGAGEVVAVGAQVSEFGLGDKVVSTFHPNWLGGHIDRADLNNSPGGPADGFACEFATRPYTHFTRAPAHLSLEHSATITCAGVTAWRAVVTDARIKPGDWVLIQGTGGVSLYALQLAKACGARVIATSSSPTKLEQLSRLGADYVINYQQDEKWGETAAQLTGGKGVDLVVEVGGPNTLGQSLIAARTGAHVAIIGAVAGFETDVIPFAIVQAKRLRLQGVTVGSREDQLNLVRAMEAHTIQPVIDQVFPLENLAEAFIALQQGGHFGKIVVKI